MESESELEQQARTIGVLYFPLPSGPKPFAQILAKALTERPSTPAIRLPKVRKPEVDNGSLHASLCAALASVARSRVLMVRAQQATSESQRVQDKSREARADAKRSRAALRAAVTDYARQLRAERVSENKAVEIVAEVLRDCASIVAAEQSVASVLTESESWTREVYRAA